MSTNLAGTTRLKCVAGLLLHQPHANERGAGNLASDMLGKILPRHLQIIFEINDYS